MKIAIASCGTRGDVQPLIALSLALQKRGHGIIFIAPPENEPMVHQYVANFVKNHHLGRNINKLSWRLMLMMTHLNLSKIVNSKRKSLGLKPVTDVYNHFLADDLLLACDKELAEAPSDSQIKWKQRGYPFLRQGIELPGEVIDFIKSGSTPIYMGFGSMPSDDSEAFVRLLAKAATNVGRRLILSEGWARLGEMSTSRNRLLVVRNVPHDKLFEHVACVVHHGGAGTTATAARAGVPQLVVPHMTDQFYWGERVFDKSLGPKPIFHSRLSEARLTSALSEVLRNNLYKERAAEMKKRLSAGEDRKMNAMVSYIEAMI